MVLGDAGCAAMRAGAALRAAAASAVAIAGRMEVIFSGCGLAAGGWRGRAATRRPGGPMWSAVVCGGGVGLRSLPSGSSWAGLLQCGRVCASASAGGKSLCGLHSGVAGGGSGVSGLCVGACLGHWAGWVYPGVWGSSRRVFVGCRVWGSVRLAWRGGSVVGVCGCSGGDGRPVSRGPRLCALVGVCGPLGGDWGGRGRG